MTRARDAYDLGFAKPQTVLKTAGRSFADVHRGLPQFDRRPLDSVVVHDCPQSSSALAVILAVTEASVNKNVVALPNRRLSALTVPTSNDFDPLLITIAMSALITPPLPNNPHRSASAG